MALNSVTEDIFNQYILQSRKEKQRRKRLLHIVLIVLSFSIVFTFIGIGRIVNSDMGANYQEGDFIFYEKISSYYQKDDVVLIQYEDSILIRRVIGVYKDKIDIHNSDGTLWVNYQKEDNSQLTMSDPLGIKFPLYVSDHQYFVLCDQRSNTTDSRKIGCIDEKDIIGKIIYTIRF